MDILFSYRRWNFKKICVTKKRWTPLTFIVKPLRNQETFLKVFPFVFDRRERESNWLWIIVGFINDARISNAFIWQDRNEQREVRGARSAQDLEPGFELGSPVAQFRHMSEHYRIMLLLVHANILKGMKMSDCLS